MIPEVIASSFRPFGKKVRCTATSTALHNLATALDRGIASAVSYLQARGAEILIEEGAPTRVRVDHTQHPMHRVSLAAVDLEPLVRSLFRLASSPDRATLSLSELGMLSSATSDNDLELYKNDVVPVLSRDHAARMPGSTWEGHLVHEGLTVEQLMQARDELLAWCSPTPTHLEREVFVDTDEGQVKAPPREAFERMLDPDTEVHQVVIWVEHPLITTYSSPYTDCQCWFAPDYSLSILQEHCMATGDYRVDIANFLRYRALVLGWAGALRPSSIAWGDLAEAWPPELRVPAGRLDDGVEMWQWFRTNLEAGLRDQSIPRWVEDAFAAQFSAAARLVTAPP